MNKIIHYIWLGGKPKPKLVLKCIDSWKKYFPNWEIKEWNESNIEPYMSAFAKEALSVGKYAFAADSIRFEILRQFGGLYFDTDVEVIKSFGEILEDNEAFSGFECTHDPIAMCNPGLLLYTKEPENRHMIHMCEFYRNRHFINPDGSFNQYTIVQAFTDYLENNGLKKENRLQRIDGFTVFPHEYFCPTNYVWSIQDFTKNTCSIHHYAGSWLSGKDRCIIALKKSVYKVLGPKLVHLILRVTR